MKSFCVVVLSTLMMLGAGTAALAQQPSTPSTDTQAADKAPGASSSSSASTSVQDRKPDASAPAVAPAPDRSSSGSSTSTSVDVKTEPRADTGKGGGDAGSAAPRTGGESRRIFGLDPIAAILIGAAILLVVILSLVAMTRGSETVSHTDVDIDRRR